MAGDIARPHGLPGKKNMFLIIQICLSGISKIWDDAHLHGRYFRDNLRIMEAFRVPPRKVAGNSVLPEETIPSPSSCVRAKDSAVR